jgi:Holliday junction DNA helicase RuvB
MEDRRSLAVSAVGRGPAPSPDLPPFTLISDDSHRPLRTPLRDRFCVSHRLEHYDAVDLRQIVLRSAGILGIEVDEAGAEEIAGRARGTPRVANRLLRRVRDFAEVKGRGRVDRALAADALEMLGSTDGLDRHDRQLLELMASSPGPGPALTLAVAIGEEADTIEDVFEPYLLQQGLIKRTPRGRVLTERGYEHLGLPVPEGMASLF